MQITQTKNVLTSAQQTEEKENNEKETCNNDLVSSPYFLTIHFSFFLPFLLLAPLTS
jgi:hypothetical protein